MQLQNLYYCVQCVAMSYPVAPYILLSHLVIWVTGELESHTDLGHYTAVSIAICKVFVFSSLQANTSREPQPELSDRDWGHHLVHEYLFLHHPHHRPASCDCTVQYHSLADCTGLLSLLWHHSCKDGSSVLHLWQPHTKKKEGILYNVVWHLLRICKT